MPLRHTLFYHFHNFHIYSLTYIYLSLYFHVYLDFHSCPLHPFVVLNHRLLFIFIKCSFTFSLSSQPCIFQSPTFYLFIYFSSYHSHLSFTLFLCSRHWLLFFWVIIFTVNNFRDITIFFIEWHTLLLCKSDHYYLNYHRRKLQNFLVILFFIILFYIYVLILPFHTSTLLAYLFVTTLFFPTYGSSIFFFFFFFTPWLSIFIFR